MGRWQGISWLSRGGKAVIVVHHSLTEKVTFELEGDRLRKIFEGRPFQATRTARTKFLKLERVWHVYGKEGGREDWWEVRSQDF